MGCPLSVRVFVREDYGNRDVDQVLGRDVTRTCSRQPCIHIEYIALGTL